MDLTQIELIFSLSLHSPMYILTALSQCRPELCKLSQLAWRGLLENKILFMEEEISQDVLEFSIRTGLFTQVIPVCVSQ